MNRKLTLSLAYNAGDEERVLNWVVRHGLANPRVRQLATAVAIAIAVATLTLLRPLDIAFWSIQSKMFTHDPSGEIVLVIDENEVKGRSVADANATLLSILEQLDEGGASRIVVDTPLRRSYNQKLDLELRRKLVALQDRLVLAAPVEDANYDYGKREPNDPMFDGIAPVASSDLTIDFLQFVWFIKPTHKADGKEFPALWTLLASAPSTKQLVHPDYTIGFDSIPRVNTADLVAGRPAAMELVRNRQVVVSGLWGDDRSVSAPGTGYQSMPPAAVHAIAAETHMRGSGSSLGSYAMILGFGAILFVVVALPLSTKTRRISYAVWTSSFVVVFVLAAWLGHRVSLADALVIAVAYAMMRGISNYRRRHLYVDAQSRLPNFAAFRRDLELVDDLKAHVIVVAKIARLDAIFATLRDSEQGEYLRQVASRLRLGEGGTQVYHDGGKYLAMVFRSADYADLFSHLEGLRAVASQAVMIGEQPIDVAITIGVDQTYGAPMANRISSAIVAADQAREAYRPVFIISDFETDSEDWDHSLQSRLEAALSENRISIKLQPKVEMQSGLFVGAEALARWTDQEHGDIPPNRFILQCERAGRLDELTKRVMKNSMDASRYLAEAGLPAKVSVNVSAIQFVDSRVIDLVCMALEETRADPRNIMIEITETARIENLSGARNIMEEIKAMGIDFSIDDFGVGSANLAALFELPFDELKIDRMFADKVATSDRAHAVVDALLRLSRDLGIRSVAEGIEELSTFEMIRDMGGDLAQGFCIARPQTLFLLEETLKLQVSTGAYRVV